MLISYLRTAFRNLIKNKVSSFINIGGLAVGMAVAILIGLWIYDEISFDKDNKNYDHIGQVWQFVKFDVEKSSFSSVPIPLAAELRTKYHDFKAVSLSSGTRTFTLANKENKFLKTGTYVEPDFVDMMSIEVIAGNRDGLKEIHSILVSASLAKTVFGSENPINHLIKLNNKESVKVAGVYKDFPDNSTFKDVLFLAPWDLLVATDDNTRSQISGWDNNSFVIYTELNDAADVDKVSAKIKDIRVKRENPPAYRPEFFIHPMSKWHLYGDFKDGKNVGGLITFVWLFGIIGIFVLLLACINFMNLSTARSEKRAKEVGIRKAVGSVRWQLVTQFLSESLLVVACAFILSLLLVYLVMPFFNEVSGKKLTILWNNPLFWLAGLGFGLLTGLIAGSYPAFYLSSFKPVKVLKGTFRVGRFATLPRKALVVLQFTVSIALIIGTIVVFRQIQFGKSRPVGYSRDGLIEIPLNTTDIYDHFVALKTDLQQSGAMTEMSEASGSITVQYGGTTDISWRTKTPDMHPLLMSNAVTYEYGKTIGWQLTQGRDFSRDFSTDSAAMILNESALKLMALKTPLGEFVKYHSRDYRVIGIIKDMVKSNPFEPVDPSFFVMDNKAVNIIDLRLNPKMATAEAIGKVRRIFQKYNPSSPFEYKFVNETFASKFNLEQRIGKLATVFAILAIFISSLGLFGLASFVAEQRTKEIGIRKVIGASVMNIWQLLSKDFVVLVILSYLIAAPIAYYFMDRWLQQKYTDYRTDISWWIFAISALGAMLITVLTVSYQAIKAAISNPVKSLKTE